MTWRKLQGVVSVTSVWPLTWHHHRLLDHGDLAHIQHARGCAFQDASRSQALVSPSGRNGPEKNKTSTWQRSAAVHWVTGHSRQWDEKNSQTDEGNTHPSNSSRASVWCDDKNKTLRGKNSVFTKFRKITHHKQTKARNEIHTLEHQNFRQWWRHLERTFYCISQENHFTVDIVLCVSLQKMVGGEARCYLPWSPSPVLVGRRARVTRATPSRKR